MQKATAKWQISSQALWSLQLTILWSWIFSTGAAANLNLQQSVVWSVSAQCNKLFQESFLALPLCYKQNRAIACCVYISSTLFCVEAFNLTSCRRLLESVTLLFSSTNWFSVSDPRGPHLRSCLLGVTLGERQRVGAISAASAPPLDGDCMPVEAGLSSVGAVWSMFWDSGWTSSWPSKYGLGDLEVAWLILVKLLSLKKYREIQLLIFKLL